MNGVQEILKSKESVYNVEFDSMQTVAAHQAMKAYSIKTIDRYKADQNRAVILEAVKLFPSVLKWDLLLWLRKKLFKRACKQAQIRADVENRKTYVIRSTNIAYIILSTADVNHNKRIRVLGKNVDAIQLHATADFVATPKRK